MERRISLIPAAIFIGVGVLFLGLNFGWWGVVVWDYIIRLWPLLIVAVGLRLLLPKGAWYDLAVILMVLVAIGAIAAAPGSFKNRIGASQPASNQTYELNQSQATKRANLTLDIGAVRLNLDRLENSDKLYELKATNLGELEINKSQQGDTQFLSFGERARWPRFGMHDRRMNLKLADSPTYTVKIDGGASRIDVNLAKLKIDSLTIDAGACTGTVTFGNLVDLTRVSIDAGASSITLRVPQDSGVRVTNESALTSNNFENAGLSRNDQVYTSSDYDQAAHKIEITISSGASSVRLERY